jgi:hypothetical protein
LYSVPELPVDVTFFAGLDTIGSPPVGPWRLEMEMSHVRLIINAGLQELPPVYYIKGPLMRGFSWKDK